MADTNTPHLKLVDQTNGANESTWGDKADANFLKIDSAYGAVLALAGITGGDTVLTEEQERVNAISVAGVLVGNATVQFSGRGGKWVFKNNTTGAFSVTAKVVGQTGVAIPQGQTFLIYCNGTDIALAAGVDFADAALTGNPTAPTQSPGNNSTRIATTAFVKAAIDVVLGGVSAAFDTLSEIATELALKATKATTLTAGTGLTGGGDLSTNRSFAVDVGTGANKIVQLTAAAKYPAVDGSLITNIVAIYPPGHLFGVTVSNGTDATNDLNIAAGSVRDSTNAANIVCAAMTKQLDAGWAPGTGQGMRNSGAAIANTLYYLYVVAKADGTQDYYAHTSTTIATVLTALQAESGGASYVYARRILAFYRSGGTILPFTQKADRLWLTTAAVTTGSGDASEGARALATLTCPPNMRAMVRVTVSAGTGSPPDRVVVQPTFETDANPSGGAAPGTTISANGGAASNTFDIEVDASSQIAYRSAGNTGQAGNWNFTVAVLGWVDDRGRSA